MANSGSEHVVKMPVEPVWRDIYPPAYGRLEPVSTLIHPMRGAKLRLDMLRVSSAMGAAAGVGILEWRHFRLMSNMLSRRKTIPGSRRSIFFILGIFGKKRIGQEVPIASSIGGELHRPSKSFSGKTRHRKTRDPLGIVGLSGLPCVAIDRADEVFAFRCALPAEGNWFFKI